MIKVVLHRVLVKPDELAEVDDTHRRAKEMGIVIASDKELKRERAAVDTGTVLEVGTTAFKDFGTDAPIKVGDRIAYAKYGGKTVIDPKTKEELLILNDEDVICKFLEE